MKPCQYKGCTDVCYGKSPNARYCHVHRVVRDKEAHDDYRMRISGRTRKSKGNKIYNRPQDNTYVRRKSPKLHSDLARDNAEARLCGLSYGQWRANQNAH